MNTKNRPLPGRPVNLVQVVLVGLTMLAGVAIPDAAAIALRLDPGLQVLAPGETGVVSVYADDVVAIRTVEITLRGDPERLLDMVATPGEVFGPVPCFIWEESEVLEPGLWHGFAVIIGSTCETSGPGELLRWTFTAGSEGGTILEPVEVKLYAPDGVRIEDVTCGHAVVLISTTTDVPGPAPRSELLLQPNPFNPATSVVVDLDRAAAATLTVHDLRGRRVATLWQGPLPAGRSVLGWHGAGAAGEGQPSGTYLFVLDVPGQATVIASGVLLR